MFEKEAEEYANEYGQNAFTQVQIPHTIERIRIERKLSFKDGAEFGFNKANEWHYVKDELPQEMQEVIICIKDEKRITRAKRIKNDLWTSPREDFNTKEIIAWKEIVLPEHKESE